MAACAERGPLRSRPSTRSWPRTCGSSCEPCSPSRRWRCSRSPPSCCSDSGSTAAAHGQPRRRRASGDGPVRGDPRRQPPVRRRARRGRLRRDPAGARRRHRPGGGEGRGAGRLPGGARGDRGPRVRDLLPRLVGGLAARGRGPRAGRPGPGGHRRAGLVDRRQLARARPAGAPRAAAAARAGDDRRRRGRGAPAGRRRPFVRRRRSMAGHPRPLRCDVPPVGYAVYDFLLED